MSITQKIKELFATTKGKINEDSIIVYAPISGKFKEMKNVKDDVFSQNMIGKGMAIVPNSEEVLSPIDGEIIVSFPTGHAYSIESSKGPQILVHVGIDTVNLKEQAFTNIAKQNTKTKIGRKLADVDLKKLKRASSTDTVVIATNDSCSGYTIKNIANGEVKAGDPLFSLEKNK